MAMAWAPSWRTRDAGALLEGGVDGLMVENMWDLPYYVGSQVQPEAMTAQVVAARAIVEMDSVPVGINVVQFLQHADGAIAGSSLKADGMAENPVDVQRVRRYMKAVRSVREG